MTMTSALRGALLALTTIAFTTLSTVCHAESGTVTLTIWKAGWIIGGSGGGGVLYVPSGVTRNGGLYSSFGLRFRSAFAPEMPTA